MVFDSGSHRGKDTVHTKAAVGVSKGESFKSFSTWGGNE